MSANEQLFTSRVETFGDLGTQSSLSDMEALRVVVNERLAAAVDEILGAFGRTIAQYQEEIDRQRRQLDSLRPDTKWHLPDPAQSPTWIKSCADADQILCLQLDQTVDEREASVDEREASTSATQIKTEADGEDCGVLEPVSNLHPAGGLEAASDDQLLSDRFETDNSDDYWNETAGLRKSKKAGKGKGQRSFKSPAESSQQQKASTHLPAVSSCKVCGETFKKKSHLLSHATTHLNECGLCGKQLEWAESMKLHLKVHRESWFRCSICGQTFTLRGNLRTHMRIHSGERPYGCTVCGKSFGRRATLVRHVRSHTGEKPFICQYCGRGFVEKGNMIVHLRTHTGERPYWCSTCNRRFTQLSCFYKHPCQRKGLTSP